MTEGFTNAAVALENLGKTTEAVQLYEHALSLHPSNEKILLPYANTLQVAIVLIFLIFFMGLFPLSIRGGTAFVDGSCPSFLTNSNVRLLHYGCSMAATRLERCSTMRRW